MLRIKLANNLSTYALLEKVREIHMVPFIASLMGLSNINCCEIIILLILECFADT